MRLYIASSWRNELQPHVVSQLRILGHEVYDFHSTPTDTSHWEDLAADGASWTPEEYIQALKHPVAEHDFKADLAGMQWAEAIVLLYPCGRSAHLEAGWAAGNGKKLCVVLAPDIVPDLMIKVADEIYPSIEAFYAAFQRK